MVKSKERKIIAAVLKEIDYDLYKSFFVNDCIEDPETVEDTLLQVEKRLQNILKDG